MSIVTTGHNVADARLHRTAAALLRAGASVKVRGLGDASQGPAGCDVIAYPTVGKLRRGFRALVWPFCVTGAHIVITTDPDASLAAWCATRIQRRIWVADVHEDYQALLKDRSWVPTPLLTVLQGAVGLMNRLIGRAEMVLVADDHVPPRKAARRVVMRNEPDFSMLPAVRDERPDGPWRAVHIGDNRTSRGLRTMVEVIAATVDDEQPWHLDLVGPVAAADRDWFRERMSHGDIRNITPHGRLEPAKAWKLAARADVGLCLLATTPAFIDAMPSKVYEYLGCGLPAVASPLPRVAELLHRTGAGVIVEGVEETTRALRRFASDQVWRDELVSAAQEAAHVARERRNTYDAAATKILALTKGNSNSGTSEL